MGPAVRRSELPASLLIPPLPQKCRAARKATPRSHTPCARISFAPNDDSTGETVVWEAPPYCFCEEVVIIPRPRDEPLVTDDADVWVAAMMFDATAGRSCLAILDGDDLGAGPVCQLWLKSFVPHGLHGCYTPELHGVL